MSSQQVDLLLQEREPRRPYKDARRKSRSCIPNDTPHSKRQKLQRTKNGNNMETSGNMHHPNNNIWSRKQNNNTQRKARRYKQS